MEPVPRPPKDNLVRAYRPGVELRAAEDGSGPTMAGHFAVFDNWTEIDSSWEGNFMERIAPGAFAKSFRPEYRDRVKVLFQHGMDPQIGDKPLGRHVELREDEVGAYYEVPLLDARYVREDILPGLEAGLYGASFRFRVIREDLEKSPRESEGNPRALPERTIRELELYEFGPVTFPAYPAATAGVRSMTDAYVLRTIFGRVESDPDRAHELLEALRAIPDITPPVGAADKPHPDEARSTDDDAGAEPHLDSEERGEPTPEVPAVQSVQPPKRRRFQTRQEYLNWISEI